MKRYQIQETCSCGARFNYEEQVVETYHSKMDNEHIRFLKAHESCRKPAVISNGKQLKMFLAQKPILIDGEAE